MRHVFVGLALIAAGVSSSAPAQEAYPSRPLRIIVPSPPGAITDILARTIAQGLSNAWGQSVIVDNRPGADEMIGAEAVAKSPADGYTLLIGSNGAFTAAPHMHVNLRYDPEKDFTRILLLGQVTPVMNVSVALPVTSVQELIAFAKSKPGELNYGSFGNGSYAHVAMEDFKLRTGTKMEHVPYKGASPAITALLSNEIAVMITNLGTIAEHAKAGAARIIAAVGAQRSAARPDLPTVAESGVPGFATGAWWGMFAPANLPAPVTDKIRIEVERILNTPEMQSLLASNTFEYVRKTPDEFTQFIRDDLDNWGRQFKAAGIKPE